MLSQNISLTASAVFPIQTNQPKNVSKKNLVASLNNIFLNLLDILLS